MRTKARSIAAPVSSLARHLRRNIPVCLFLSPFFSPCWRGSGIDVRTQVALLVKQYSSVSVWDYCSLLLQLQQHRLSLLFSFFFDFFFELLNLRNPPPSHHPPPLRKTVETCCVCVWLCVWERVRMCVLFFFAHVDMWRYFLSLDLFFFFF